MKGVRLNSRECDLSDSDAKRHRALRDNPFEGASNGSLHGQDNSCEEAIFNTSPELVVAGIDASTSSLELWVSREVGEEELLDRYSSNRVKVDSVPDDVKIFHPDDCELIARYAGYLERTNDDVIISHPNDDDIIRRYAPISPSRSSVNQLPTEAEVTALIEAPDGRTSCKLSESSHESRGSTIHAYENLPRESKSECADGERFVKQNCSDYDGTSLLDEEIRDVKPDWAGLIPKTASSNVDNESSCESTTSLELNSVAEYDTNTILNNEPCSEISESGTELSDEKDTFGELSDAAELLESDRLTEEFNDSCYDSVDADDAIQALTKPSGSCLHRRNITVYNVCCDKDLFTSISIDRKKDGTSSHNGYRRDKLHGLLKNINQSNIFGGPSGNHRKGFVAKKFKDKSKFKRLIQSNHLLSIIRALETTAQTAESVCIKARRSLRKNCSANNTLKTGCALKDEFMPLLNQQLSLIKKIRTNVQ